MLMQFMIFWFCGALLAYCSWFSSAFWSMWRVARAGCSLQVFVKGLLMQLMSFVFFVDGSLYCSWFSWALWSWRRLAIAECSLNVFVKGLLMQFVIVFSVAAFSYYSRVPLFNGMWFCGATAAANVCIMISSCATVQNDGVWWSGGAMTFELRRFWCYCWLSDVAWCNGWAAVRRVVGLDDGVFCHRRLADAGDWINLIGRRVLSVCYVLGWCWCGVCRGGVKMDGFSKGGHVQDRQQCDVRRRRVCVDDRCVLLQGHDGAGYRLGPVGDFLRREMCRFCFYYGLDDTPGGDGGTEVRWMLWSDDCLVHGGGGGRLLCECGAARYCGVVAVFVGATDYIEDYAYS